MKVSSGLYFHEAADGKTWHLDQQLSREQFDVLQQVLAAENLDPADVRAVTFGERAPLIDPSYRAIHAWYNDAKPLKETT